MKTKFWSVCVILVSFIAMPAFSSTYTDKELEYHGSDDGYIIYPTSLEPDLLAGTLSLTNQTIETAFLFDLGEVTFQLVNANKQVIASETTVAVQGSSYTMHIDNLKAGDYQIVCLIANERPQVANFSIVE